MALTEEQIQLMMDPYGRRGQGRDGNGENKTKQEHKQRQMQQY